jgi:hypothetical protein
VPLPRQSPRTRALLAVPAVVLAVATVAACGGGSGSGAAAGAAATSGAAGAVAPAAASGSPRAAGGNGFGAYTTCLKAHGLTIPTRPTGAARPSGAPRSRGAGGGFGGAFNPADPKTAAAVKACASLRPTGGFGGGRLGNNAALQSELKAYTTCLSSHGVVLPTQAAPAAGASGAPGGRRNGFGGLGALNTADPKTAAAITVCAPLRPTFGRPAGAAGGAAPTPAATPSA